jgi:hypothetical protein
VLSLLTAYWFPIPAVALATGGLCGILNALWVLRGIERTMRTQGAGSFVLSSLLRIGVFGIVPVAFAAIGPWWAMFWYFAGFFLPTVVYAHSIGRSSK